MSPPLASPKTTILGCEINIGETTLLIDLINYLETIISISFVKSVQSYKLIERFKFGRPILAATVI